MLGNGGLIEGDFLQGHHQIIIRPARRPRHNWEEQFQVMAANGNGRLLDEAIATRWDKEEWEW
jgi:hypothetical protein